jgi:hypothetical protein
VSKKSIHIISFDVPYPANYGGVIDVFYKIKALTEGGLNVHLHCFEYGRSPSEKLSQLCASVTYYKRKKGITHFFSNLPYIVSTRQSKLLLKSLLNDDYPILFEGLHSCYLLNHPLLENRTKFVRSHNIEHDYYTGLAKVENNFFKTIFFSREAKKLKSFQKNLKSASAIFAISHKDTEYLSRYCKYENVFYLPAFHAYNDITVKAGKGNFALYHGNLSVGENNEAALYLVNQIFNSIFFPLIIAGSSPSSELIKAAQNHSNIKVEANAPVERINQLIADAQINILPTFQSTGIKLKLIAALFSGRHCIVNSPMVVETGLENACIIADSPDEMKKMINQLANTTFTEKEIEKRKNILFSGFSNEKNILTLINLIR